MGDGVVLRDVTVAYVMIKTERGKAEDVAAEVSGFDEVRWAVVVTGPYDVIAGVRVSDNQELGSLVVHGIQPIPGVRNPLTSVMTSYYKDGEMQMHGVNGPP